jgi:phosphatidylserine/phosphatidylglycerophosphate/cardiolipin synthase-like enzyme
MPDTVPVHRDGHGRSSKTPPATDDVTMPHTGPVTQAQSPVRGQVELIVNEQHLQRVVIDGMLKAEVSLDIMTADFKAMLVPPGGLGGGRRNSGGRGAPSIVHHLAKLAQKGVEVRLLHAGVPSGPALRELKKLMRKLDAEGGSLAVRRCPRLHAKAVIVDACAMYLGSANLTGAGLGAKSAKRRNFEMGVWTHSSPLIDGVLQQFNMLWEGQGCRDCQRKDVCPVPLEEPDL